MIALARSGAEGWLGAVRALFGGFGASGRRTARPIRPAAGSKRRATDREADAPPIDVLAVRQEIWGDGCLLPGGPEQAIDLVKPFGVNSNMSLLDLTAGLGGPSRRLAAEFEVYITGLERDADCAARGHAKSVQAGLAKQVPIAAYDPETVTLKPRAYDGVFGQNLLSPVRDKLHLIRQVRQTLRAGGQFTFRDWVAAGPTRPTRLLEVLNRYEPVELDPWSAPEIVRALADVGLDCRVNDDVSEDLITALLDAWKTMLRSPKLRADRRRELVCVLGEAEAWCVRLEALRSGQIRYHRFYAVLSGR